MNWKRFILNARRPEGGGATIKSYSRTGRSDDRTIERWFRPQWFARFREEKGWSAQKRLRNFRNNVPSSFELHCASGLPFAAANLHHALGRERLSSEAGQGTGTAFNIHADDGSSAHVGLLDMNAALESLPGLLDRPTTGEQRTLATGTDAFSVAPQVALNSVQPRDSQALSRVASIPVATSLESQESLSNKAFREVLTTKEKWGCSDLNREPTDYEPVVELTERVETPRAYDDGSVLVAPMVALQSPENACERVRTRDEPSDAEESLPPDLARVVAEWPMLPPDVKAKISAIVSQAEDCRRSCKMAAQGAGNHQRSCPLKSDEPAC